MTLMSRSCGVRDHPVDAGDDVDRVAGAVAAGDLDRHDPRIGGDAEELLGMIGDGGGIGARLAAGDDAAHRGAVSVGVEELQWRGRRPRRRGRRRPRRCRRGWRRRSDTGVDDGDVDACARDALRPEIAGADLIDDVVHRARRQRRGVDAEFHRARISGEHRRIVRLEADADRRRDECSRRERCPALRVDGASVPHAW